MSHEEPAIRPLRIVGRRLAVPGIIGVRDPHGIPLNGSVHVLIGPDAGFPESQPMDDWKRDLALADVRALPPEVRSEAGIQLPEEERAELEAQDREMADLGLSSCFNLAADERTLAELAVEQRARMAPLDVRARRVLTAHGYGYWLAGYTRHSSMLWVHRIGGPSPFRASVSRWSEIREDESGEAPPGWMDEEKYFALWRTRWFDRMFRALSDGAVTEPGLLFANGHGELDEVVEDDVVHAGVEAAARMAAGADEVLIPLHGPARRVRLPAFVMRAWDTYPLEVSSGEPEQSRDVHVPAEDAWVLSKDLG
ncbi:hypothetical protein [Pyxidicoccus trucidator]|uniref:hypothetical protein n=1 Tax=Pyxidicoccus trucidator TaxID=2709662 RepID=UPI001966D420|nr:hypothetical protein [Pyxidicoccus trucidator]